MCRTTTFSAVVLVAAALLVVTSLVNAAGSPWLMVPAKGQCFPPSTPDADICHPERCTHLFNRTGGATLSPTLLAPGTYPSDYAFFRCTVETQYYYDSQQLGLTCKKPRCDCHSYGSTAQCYPTEMLSCDGHSCPNW